MKLYYSPLACSFAVDISLREAGLPFELERVDTKAKKTASGQAYLEINPKGYVPALELDDGQVLTEAAAVLQYVADKAPAAKLAPPAGSLERARMQEWLSWTGTELHKSFGPLFNPAYSEERKNEHRTKIGQWLDFLENALNGRDYLVGGGFTVADAYTYVVLNWTNFTGIKLDGHPRVQRYVQRIAERPSVKAAFAAETKPA